MSITQLNFNNGGFLLKLGQPFVQVSNRWGHWIDTPYIQPLEAALAIAPSIGHASFLFRYGEVRWEDKDSYSWYYPERISNYFIRIILIHDNGTFEVLWVGIINENELRPHGIANFNPSGDQIIKAKTLDWMLEKVSIIGSYTTDGFIQSCQLFNLRHEWIPHPVGNRSEFTNDDGVYVFGPDRKMWTALDVLNYLNFYYIAPSGITLRITGQVEALLGWHHIWPLEGLNIRQAIDKLIDRRRGLGWRINSDGNRIEIVIFTTLENDVVTDTLTVPGNNNKIWINFDKNISIERLAISETEAQFYDEIIIQGAKVISTFTIGTHDGTLVPLWSQQDEDQYKGIRQESSSNAYTADNVRAQDRWKHIYQLFALRSDWDWTVKSRDGLSFPVAPKFDERARLITPWETGAYYNDNNKPFQRVTRLQRPYTAIGPWAGNIQYMEPQVFATPSPDGQSFNMPSDSTLPSGKAVVRGDMAGYLNGPPPFSVTMADIAPAIEINAGLPHIMGANHYDTTTDGDSGTIPWYDWKTILATLCIETDVKPTVVVTMNNDGAPWRRTLHIDVPHAEFWWIVPGTIMFQNPDLSLVLAGGYASRDDTHILRSVAALAASWYGVRRTPISWTEKSYVTNISPGAMVTSIASENGIDRDINTVVSVVSYDFVNMTTSFQTGFGEMDIAIILDIPGMSDPTSVGKQFARIQYESQQLRSRVASIPNRQVVSQQAGVVMGQLTAVNEDGTFTVDIFESGTANDTESTQTIKDVYPEVSGSKPDIGSWGSIVTAAGKKYMVMAAASTTGIVCSFFCDLFDRADTGVMNGYWTGALGSWTIVSDAAIPVQNGLLSSASVGSDKEYNIGLIVGIEDKSEVNSNGYIVATPSRTFTLKFGLLGFFQVVATTWQVENTASVTAKTNAANTRNAALTAALNTRNAALIDPPIDWASSIIGVTDTHDSIDPVGNGGNVHVVITVISNTPTSVKIRTMQTENQVGTWLSEPLTPTSTVPSQSRSPNIFAAVTAANNIYNAAVTAANNTYNAAVTAATDAYTAAVANLTQATYISLIIYSNGTPVVTTTPQMMVLKDPYTQEYALNVTISGTTITVTAGDDITLSYTNIVVDRICSSVSVVGATNKHWLKSIKVWKKDKPEPTQTGYGTYRADGFVLYKDKYHTAIKNEDGRITSYTYDPLA